MKREINFDYNASAGLLPQVRESLYDIDLGLNPSSVHRGGQRSRALIETSREEILSSLNCSERYDLVFTSGATESNNMAVFSSLGGGEAVTLSVEHPSILEPLKRAQGLGHVVHFVTPLGANWVEVLLSKIGPDTKLVSIMAVNNETGRIFDLEKIVPLIRQKSPKALVHSDLVQAFGKMPLEIEKFDLDLASISGHKIGALSGSGALIIKKDLEISPLIVGGAQELRRRAGTENVMGIVSFGLAATFVKQNLSSRLAQMQSHSEYLRGRLTEELPEIQIVESAEARVANTTCIRIPDVKADDLIVALDLEGIRTSSGAACASGKPEPSHVLLSLGLSEREARECLRISVDPALSAELIEESCEKMIDCVRRFRRAAHGV